MLGTTPGEGVQPKEALSYSLAGLGQNLICGLVGSYVSYYFTNGLLLSPVVVGIIMLCVRVFDALNDPIMGSVVDRTKTKYGKCRPFLLWMPIPIAVMTVVLFLPLPPRVVSTTVIMTIVYTIWSVVYTIVDVPYWGLATAMTSDTNVRGTILTVARLFCTAGSGLISILIPNISNSWMNNAGALDNNGAIISGMEETAAAALRANYWWLALVIVVISVPAFFIGFKNSKERFYDESGDVRSLKENLKYLFKNKPLLIIILSGVLGAGRGLFMYSGVYFATYNLAAINFSFLGMKGVALVTIITMSIVPGGLIASVLVPWCTRHFGKKQTLIWSHIIGGIVMFVSYFVGWDSTAGMIVFFIALVINGIPQGFYNIISYAMIADTVDYLEWKEGVRAEGICFAMQTLINKMGMAAGAAIACFGLGWAGIDPSLASTFSIATNKQGLDIMFAVTCLIPAISTILLAVPIFFYKFDEKQQAIAVAEIEARKAKAVEIEE